MCEFAGWSEFSLGTNVIRYIFSVFCCSLACWENISANILTLILLNNLISHTHFWLSANKITPYNVFIQIHKLNDKQCRSWSAIWSGSTVCKGRGCREQQIRVKMFFFLFSENRISYGDNLHEPAHITFKGTFPLDDSHNRKHQKNANLHFLNGDHNVISS